ncbi:hypothetical protein OUZ56_022424 [Daphnia magna]|uniref:Uncharacterized protein n=1 Tax=Daphnia magna TaxID=35525 RepID=A0ABR0AX16_9CRUS|nr:hypothetical protein OUZ56_022424 [Daphnia magna]
MNKKFECKKKKKKKEKEGRGLMCPQTRQITYTSLLDVYYFVSCILLSTLKMPMSRPALFQSLILFFVFVVGSTCFSQPALLVQLMPFLVQVNKLTN